MLKLIPPGSKKGGAPLFDFYTTIQILADIRSGTMTEKTECNDIGSSGRTRTADQVINSHILSTSHL